MTISKRLSLLFTILSQLSLTHVNAQTTDVSELQVRCEPEVTAEFQRQGDNGYLLARSKPSELGPSIYFGMAKVVPGHTYSYQIKGTRMSDCRLYLYVISPQGNLVWPGAELKNGEATSTFTIPDGITSVTVGLTFLNPKTENESVLIEDISLVKGSTSPSSQQQYIKLERPRRYSLFNNEDVSITCESGVVASPLINQGKEYLKVTASASKRAPSIYFGEVEVNPGNQYTYFLKGRKNSDCRILSYVTSAKGNIVWPGPDLENGFARTVFSVPDSVNMITLGLTFLYPTGEKQSVTIEDITLYAGNVEMWEEKMDPISFSSPFNKEKPWVFWVMMISIVIILIGLILNKRHN